jgi:hypothetical protein
VKQGNITPNEYAEKLFDYLTELIEIKKCIFILPFCREALHYAKERLYIFFNLDLQRKVITSIEKIFKRFSKRFYQPWIKSTMSYSLLLRIFC